MQVDGDWTGVGLYTAAEASHLLGIPRARVRRWLAGYDAGDRHHQPLWRPQLPKLDDQLGLGFLDLMQLRLVDRLVSETRISLRAIRRALELVRKDGPFDHEHPFVTSAFQTDGHRVFLELGRETGEKVVYDVLGRQFGFHDIIAPSFRDVDIDDVITRWWPLGKGRCVVLDPALSFGAPVSPASGVPTATLALAAQREGSPARAARWYQVSENEVRDAVAFERRMLGSSHRRLAA